MVNYFRESDIVKKAQRSSFKLNPIAAAIAMAMASQFAANVAHAGSGFGIGMHQQRAGDSANLLCKQPGGSCSRSLIRR